MTIRSLTKTVSINRSPAQVFDFLVNAGNWPKWAIHNIKSITKGENGWWVMETPVGFGNLRIRPNLEFGILDHDFQAPEASWTVPARVVPNADGAEFMITFFQPANFSGEFFDEQIKLVDQELAKLKEILETAPRSK